MVPLHKLLFMTARDFQMQTMTVTEIASAMEPVARGSLREPREFAQKVERLLQNEASEAIPTDKR